MSNPLIEFRQKYFKRPDCWKSLLILGGLLFIDKFIVEARVRTIIFGHDGKGGEILLMKSRMDHHEQEFREERKKFYWHQRAQEHYIPCDHLFNSKLDYKTLSYNYSHYDTYSDPKKIPAGHHPETETFSGVPHELFHRD